MVRVVMAVVLALGLTAGPAQAEGELDLDQILYGQFESVKSFGSIDVSLLGTAEKLLSKEEIERYVRLRFRNSFGGIKVEPQNIMRIIDDRDLRAATGSLRVRVWTVGEDYPIARHVEVQAGNYINFRIFETASLGYSPKDRLKETTEKSIEELINDAAIAFFKGRGEM